jgi:hypothetical protein
MFRVFNKYSIQYKFKSVFFVRCFLYNLKADFLQLFKVIIFSSWLM